MALENSQTLQLTPLDKLHRELGARMVAFAGYDMPVQYTQGIIKEHLHTRSQAGLFDVSHMGQLVISGSGATEALEALLPADLSSLDINNQVYSLLTNDQGGIIDDLIVTRWADEVFFLVVNAACKATDIAYLREHLPSLQVQVLENQALLALQGPEAARVLECVLGISLDMVFMQGQAADFEGAECFVSRSGYTGEDGFEISLPGNSAEAFARRLLAFDEVAAIGLGARDSLRLEAGLCLYGHELSVETTPVEAGLSWAIAKVRRTGGNKCGGFPGAEIILAQLENGVERKRVGLLVDGKAPVREGAELVGDGDDVIGVVTSGGFSPSLEQPIAMAYIAASSAQLGDKLSAIVRGKERPVTLAAMPLVAQRYHRA